ncbi:MAG: flavodoxin family protein [Bacteroidota bacterium]
MDLTAAYREILVLVGTQTGNSELVAEDIADHLAELGFECDLTDMADAYPELLVDYRQVIVVMCTWSNGTPPDNAVAFVEGVEAVAPILRHLAYGVIALGDHDYDPYYCVAAYRLADRLDALGATRAVDHLDVDGTPRPSHYEAARAWAERCAQAFAEAFAGVQAGSGQGGG